jgi:1,4-dihydroxy-2-naphthoate polyprenyltransferase
VVMTVAVAVAVVVLGALTSWWALLGLVGVVVLAVATRSVLAGAQGPALIRVLQLTGMAELLMAVGLTLGWVIR